MTWGSLAARIAKSTKNTIRDISGGQYSTPVRVVAFNTAEGWSRDVTEDIEAAGAFGRSQLLHTLEHKFRHNEKPGALGIRAFRNRSRLDLNGVGLPLCARDFREPD